MRLVAVFRGKKPRKGIVSEGCWVIAVEDERGSLYPIWSAGEFKSYTEARSAIDGLDTGLGDRKRPITDWS